MRFFSLKLVTFHPTIEIIRAANISVQCAHVCMKRIYIYTYTHSTCRASISRSPFATSQQPIHTQLLLLFSLYTSRVSARIISLFLFPYAAAKKFARHYTRTHAHTHTNTLCALGLLKCACVFLSRGERFFYGCANKRRLESGEFVLLGGTREVGHCNFMRR